MQYKKVNDGYLLKLEKGEEVITQITNFAKENNLLSAHFEAIGAVSSIEIGFYHLDIKKYSSKNINKNLEISSLTGNISRFENEPAIHAHGLFSDENFETMGGHVIKAIVSATCEIYITQYNIPIERKINNEIGLKLLDLE